jgi:hypothetical protein
MRAATGVLFLRCVTLCRIAFGALEFSRFSSEIA